MTTLAAAWRSGSRTGKAETGGPAKRYFQAKDEKWVGSRWEEDVGPGRMAGKLRGLADGLDVGGERREESRGAPGLGLTWVMVLFSVMGSTGKMGESILLLWAHEVGDVWDTPVKHQIDRQIHEFEALTQ